MSSQPFHVESENAVFMQRDAANSESQVQKGQPHPQEGEGFNLEGKSWQTQQKWPFYKQRYALREYFSEFFGTWLLIVFGEGVNASQNFISGDYASQQSNASYLSITLGWGIGLTMGLFVSMGVSGGHLSPAVTFANCLFGACPWRKFPGYVISQVLGAFFAAMCIYGLFYTHFQEAKSNLPPGQTMTTKYGGIFATYPNEANAVCVFSELLNTTLLLFCIMGMLDPRMTPASTYKPVAVGLLVFVIGVATGCNSGYAINPARDLGPRIASALLFRSTEPFTLHAHYFLIPMFVPLIGATLGMFLYVFFIIPQDIEPDADEGKS